MLVDKLTAIANAIRAKSGKTEALTLDQMPIEIEALSAEEQLKASEYPSYVHAEVLEIANKVRSVQKSDSIISIMMSDSHYPADQTGTTAYESNKASTVQANQAAKALAYMLDIDFFAHMGDISAGAKTTTPDMLKSQIDGFLSYFLEANSDLPIFVAIGNHDAGIYYHDEVADGNIYTMTGQYLYDNFTSHSESDNTVVGNTTYGGYCYRDFPNKKLRVFLLNTSEKLVGAQKDQATYGAQRVWFANALLDLNNKTDASSWGFIVLCHYPADYGGNMNLSELLKAYVTGASFTITDPTNNYYVGDNTSQAVNFSGKNKAKFMMQFHGHVHNFKTSKLYSYATGSGAQYDGNRMCIPNVQFDRENYYTTVGSYTDINFSESTSYTKTANSANGTSFVVNVINPSEEKVYSFCYGAGYDRVVGIGSVKYYSVSRNLINMTTDSTTVSVEENKSLSEIITINSGCEFKSLTITMGGVDISSSAVSVVNGAYQISIAKVTGDIVITAKAAQRPNFINLVPLSLNTDGTDYYIDGDGYDDGMYITASNTLAALSGYVTTGYISVPMGTKTIRIVGDGISFSDTYCRVAFYDSSFNIVRDPTPATNMGIGNYNGTVIEESTTAKTWVIGDTTYVPAAYSAVYIRVSAKGKGENLIVTVNEEITYGAETTPVKTCSIAQSLTRVSSSNSTSTVTAGQSFTTTLTATSGYELQTPNIVMNDANITSWAYKNGVISIPSVVGNVTITAAAVKTVNNQLSKSTDTDGSIYNGVGYKANTYMSSGNATSTTSTLYASGFIPVKAGDTVYFKNCTFQTEQSYHRVAFFKSTKTWLTTSNTTTDQLGGNVNITFTKTGNNITAMAIRDTGYYAVNDLGYIRFCCSYLGPDSIVTVNEPID